MELKRAIERARRNAAFERKEAKRYEAEGMDHTAKLAEREADMLETLAEAAERSLQNDD